MFWSLRVHAGVTCVPGRLPYRLRTRCRTQQDLQGMLRMALDVLEAFKVLCY